MIVDKAHAGHRDNPIEIVAPGDLDRAVLRVWAPSDGQAAAGNYQKAHVIVAGLPITIETPLDRTRSGVGPDGTPWSVRMPAHYGYFKRSEGADGDAVDVYVGPEAHRAHELPVWVVDQVDSETAAFDEHKCMLGFCDSPSAHRTYLSAFSDGKGQKRLGGVTRMTVEAFRSWLANGNTKKPLSRTLVAKALRSGVVSASACGCGTANTACTCPPKDFGFEMATQNTSPSGVSMLSKTMAAIWPRLTKAERVDLLADAATTATLSLNKATDHLLLEGDGGDRIPMVEDQWDGPPDDRLETVESGGPDSSVPRGKVGVGPSEDASGAGADRMERHYSRPTPQMGVQRATEELGAKLRAHGAALKATVSFAKSLSARVGFLEKSLVGDTTTAGTLSKADIDAAVAKALPGAVAVALAKAIPDILRAVAKAEGEKEEREEKEEDEEDDGEMKAEMEKAEKAEPFEEMKEEDEKEDEDEDESKKAMKKAAAQQRLVAKSLVRLAKRAAQDAEDAIADGRMHGGARLHGKAASRIAKARIHAELAKSMRGGQAGPSMKAIEASIGTVAKAMKETKAKNQDRWPVSEKSTVGKSAVASTTTTQAPDNEAVKAATTAVEKALSGMALLQANVQQLMQVVGGQSRDPSTGGVPPVNELFKGDVVLLNSTPEAKIGELMSQRAISASERDKAMDALQAKRMNMPAVEQMIAVCPAPVQAILRAA